MAALCGLRGLHLADEQKQSNNLSIFEMKSAVPVASFFNMPSVIRTNIVEAIVCENTCEAKLTFSKLHKCHCVESLKDSSASFSTSLLFIQQKNLIPGGLCVPSIPLSSVLNHCDQIFQSNIKDVITSDGIKSILVHFMMENDHYLVHM